MSCSECLLWTEPKGASAYGMCKPTADVLPFWASRHQGNMQTQTLRTEGKYCEAFRQKRVA